jgi:rfaE bifunctional protein kinase chain/domain
MISDDRPSPFRDSAVLVLGDLMLDHYVYGRAERISPEAPVPVLDWEREEWRLGGAANVALNLKTLGAEPVLIGMLGDDEPADRLRAMLAGHGIAEARTPKDPGRPTTVKTRFFGKNQQLLRLDRESVDDHPTAVGAELFAHVENALSERRIGAVVIQDYDKGTLTPALIAAVCTLAAERGVPVAVDPKKKNFGAYRQVDLFKPNLKEIGQALGREIRPELAHLKRADAELRQTLCYRKTVITLGENGLYWSDESGNSGLLPANRLSVVDVCGAGDSVVSVLSAGMAVQMPFGEAVRLANLAGGVACTRKGVAPVAWEDLVS